MADHKLYGVGMSPYVRKVRIILDEKGIEYDYEPVLPMDLPPEQAAMTPLGKIPFYQHNGRPLADSSVIVAYLERLQPEPAAYPADAYDYARTLWFEEFADTALLEATGPVFMERMIAPTYFDRPTDEQKIKTVLEEKTPIRFAYLDKEIGGNDFIVANQFTVADAAIAPSLINFEHAGESVDSGKYPNLARYFDGLKNRPSIAKTIEEDKAAFAQMQAGAGA